MNIHIKDEKLFNDLWSSTIFSMKMGSVLYGLNDKDSDTDFICITAPAKNQTNSFIKSIHQIQYKDELNNVDYVFTDIYSFFWNLLNGDSTINFEVLHSEDFKSSDFGKLFSEITPELRTYSIIIAYLGFAKRDIKYFHKEKTLRDKFKKILHIERGYRFANEIFRNYNGFNLKNEYVLASKKQYSMLMDLDKIRSENKIEEFSDEELFNDFLDLYSGEIEILRKNFINKALENKELTRFLNIESQKKLDKILLDFSKTTYFKEKQLEYIDLEPYYLVNENELKY